MKRDRPLFIIGRLIKPQEIADLAAFVSSPRPSATLEPPSGWMAAWTTTLPAP